MRFPSRAQLAFFHSPAALGGGHPGFIDTILGMYGRPHGDGTTLIGVGGEEEVRADPDRFQQENDPSYIQEAARRAARRLPGLADAPYVRVHAGLYDMSLDTRELIGPAQASRASTSPPDFRALVSRSHRLWGYAWSS